MDKDGGLVIGFKIDFGFVDAEDIDLVFVEVGDEPPLVDDGADAVDVPGGDFEVGGCFSLFVVGPHGGGGFLVGFGVGGVGEVVAGSGLFEFPVVLVHERR